MQMQEKRRRGRPVGSVLMDSLPGIRCDAWLASAIRALAERQDRTVSNLIRGVLRSEIRRQVTEDSEFADELLQRG